MSKQINEIKDNSKFITRVQWREKAAPAIALPNENSVKSKQERSMFAEKKKTEKASKDAKNALQKAVKKSVIEEIYDIKSKELIGQIPNVANIVEVSADELAHAELILYNYFQTLRKLKHINKTSDPSVAGFVFVTGPEHIQFHPLSHGIDANSEVFRIIKAIIRAYYPTNTEKETVIAKTSLGPSNNGEYVSVRNDT